MLVCAHAFAIDRGAAVHVDVELDLRAGLPGLAVIGLGGRPARDLRERVQAAVLNSGYGFPRRRVTVNLAPAPSSTSPSPAACSPPAGSSTDRGSSASACVQSSRSVASCVPVGRVPLLPTRPRRPVWPD
jgi:magnesium chelatase family protein